MRSAPTLLAAAEDKRFHEQALLPDMQPVPSSFPLARVAQHQFSHASCSRPTDTAFVPLLRAMRARTTKTKSQETDRQRGGPREREGERETTDVPESILPLIWSLSRSLHSSLSAICQRQLLPLQQVAPPTRWTDGRTRGRTVSSLYPPNLTYSDN